jgi:sterol desaturase/sphingolipid hydroxylase (fatty acid hydroxylase superfamily)
VIVAVAGGGLDGLWQRLADFAALIHLVQLAKSTAYGILVYTAFLGAVFILEGRAGADPARYRTRNFANDVVYTLFYKGGYYNILLLAALTNVLEPKLGFLQFNLLRAWPWQIGLAVFWVAGDFVTYWWHRWQHSNRVLWAFHSIHHSQEQMTLFTASRRHPLENLSMDVLLYFVLFHLLLGVPTQSWMPLGVFVTCISAVQHAQLDWRFGPLYRVLVSPRFHAYHHSVEPDHANANYGFLFSFWDYLFGTAVAEQPRPTRFGVDGLDMGERLTTHLVNPFRLLWGSASAEVPAPPAPAPSVESPAARP